MGKAAYPTLRNIQKKKQNLSKYDRLSAYPKPDQELEKAAVLDLASSSRNRYAPLLPIPAAGALFPLF